MKRKIIRITVVFYLVLLTSCSITESYTPVLSESVKTQEDTTIITTGDLALIEYYEGVVKPKTIEITAREIGILEEWRVSLGDRVEQGDTILVLRKTQDFIPNDWNMNKDDIRYRLQEIDLKLDILETKVRVSSIELEIVQLDIKELELEKEYLSALIKKDNEQDILPVVSQEGFAKYHGIENEDFFVVTAPVNGTIIYREEGSKGEKISATTILCTLATEEKILECSYINDSVISNADQIYGVIDGNEVALEQDNSEKSDYLYVSRLERKTYLQGKDNSLTLNVGDYIPIYVVAQTRANINYIPVDALHSDIEGYYIYMLSEGEWKITRVEIGLMTASYVEVISNIQQGEVVLVAK